MGVDLAPLIVRETIELQRIEKERIAVDANNILHQFLSSIRTTEGSPLRDLEGNITSHLIGLLFRSTALIHDHRTHLIFVFDGSPPELKKGEMRRRRKRREKATREWKEALEKGDYATAKTIAVRSGRLTSPMLQDAKKLLDLLGIPYVQAPGEAEAQSAHLARKGDVWATNSRDYDSLLFGTPCLLRYLTASRKPELITLHRLLSDHEISREQLVDIAILMGTDYNEGITGVGPKTALKLIKKHGSIEGLPKDKGSKLTEDFEEVRKLFLKPEITTEYALKYGELEEEGVYKFLCYERELSRDRVETAVERMKDFYSQRGRN
ncbi:flap endonuclease-1 [Candidatus Bathyarchaeota archaeon]|nr:flap endonuclease-1 [Candidatus Bathyarchaeota archaeon]NIU80796.1 flap endonuclease-1 [Candidatus Bathyarchaeota archaeon]NIV67421.1 flap endonuclease-1 [Candidatus Bathyarchaeota archaeon]NIW15965.1 flap endonuclease-1 [Candidatus Bathyarchaeota archaeon]NIW34067.1 flap endonuclease-1 [Candidatus Bathyarchaeota archaeon]